MVFYIVVTVAYAGTENERYEPATLIKFHDLEQAMGWRDDNEPTGLVVKVPYGAMHFVGPEV